MTSYFYLVPDLVLLSYLTDDDDDEIENSASDVEGPGPDTPGSPTLLHWVEDVSIRLAAAESDPDNRTQYFEDAAVPLSSS